MEKKQVSMKEAMHILDDMLRKFESEGKYRKGRQVVRDFYDQYVVCFKGDSGIDIPYKYSAIRKFWSDWKTSGEIHMPMSYFQKEPENEQPEIPKKTDQEVLQDDISLRREKAKNKELQRRYNAAIVALEESELRYDTLIQIKEEVDIIEMPVTHDHSRNTSTAIVMLSDWHFEETVDRSVINNLNEYNLKVAEKRWFNCIQRSLRLVQKERNTDDMDSMILWLGGDFITGYIHEELEESNSLSPTQATLFAKEKIITAIKFYLQHGNFKKIVVVCNYGNHGRTIKKPRVSTGYKNSYEWMMYHDIKQYFQGNEVLQFIIPNGLFAYVKQYDKMNRFWHGDNIKYNGGVGGLTIPLRKAIMEMDKQIKADFSFMGHYHTYYEATQSCQVNGSGIGYGPYAQRINAPIERPMQGFRTLHSKYGYTTKMPIICD